MSPKSKKKSGKKEPNKPQLRTRKKKNYKEIKEENTFDEIDRSIERLGLIIKDVEGDGNCLFRALSDQMFGDESHHSELRQKVCDYIQENSEHFQNFFSSDDETFEKHLERMRNIGTFGDNFELVAFANMNSLDIHIYQDDSVNIMVIKGASLNNDSNESPETKQAVLHLAYHSWEHYSSIRNITGPFDGLPEIDLDKIKQTLSEHQKQPNSELVSEQESDQELQQEQEDFNPDKPKLTSKEVKALERIERVKSNTGCQDVELIKSVLAENNNTFQKAVRVIKKQQREAAKATKKAKKDFKSIPGKSVQTKLDGVQGIIEFPNSSTEKEETSPKKIRKINLSPNPYHADFNSQTVLNTADFLHPDKDASCQSANNSIRVESGLVTVPLDENKAAENNCYDEDALRLLDLSISDGTNQSKSLAGEGCTHDSSLDDSSLTPCTGSQDKSVADPIPSKAIEDITSFNKESNTHQNDVSPNSYLPVLDTPGRDQLATPNTYSNQVCVSNFEEPNSFTSSSELKMRSDGLHIPDPKETPGETEVSLINTKEKDINLLESKTESDQTSKKVALSSPLKKKTKVQPKKKLNASPKKNTSNDKTNSPPQLSYILI